MAILQAIRNRKKNLSCVKYILKYVTRDGKIGTAYVLAAGPPFDESTNDYEKISDSWLSVKNIYGKNSGRMYKHYVISFHKDEKGLTPDKVLEICKEWAEMFFKKYQYVICYHEDGKNHHPHGHIVINSVSYCDGKKISQSRQDLEDQKQYLRDICKERGYHVPEKGKHFNGDLIEGGRSFGREGKYSSQINDRKNLALLECAIAIIKVLPKSTSWDEFISGMDDLGWTVNYKPRNKHISYQNKDGEKFRTHRIERLFSNHEENKDVSKKLKLNKEALENEFIQNRLRLNNEDIDQDEFRSTEYYQLAEFARAYTTESCSAASGFGFGFDSTEGKSNRSSIRNNIGVRGQNADSGGGAGDLKDGAGDLKDEGQIRGYQSDKDPDIQNIRTGINNIRTEINNIRTEIENRSNESSAERTRLNNSRAGITDTEHELYNSRAEITDTEHELKDSRAEIDDSRTEISDSRTAYEDAASTLIDAKTKLNDRKSQKQAVIKSNTKIESSSTKQRAKSKYAELQKIKNKMDSQTDDDQDTYDNSL